MNSVRFIPGRWLLAIGLLITILAYGPGLKGGWLFDDYPNIVDNPAVQPHAVSWHSLTRAVLSSPASEFKRPLSSLSFAANYLTAGLDPYWMKLTNLIIHLLNGVLFYALTCEILKAARRPLTTLQITQFAALIATCWLILPINLTAVLYVVQRMESMANLFVLIGLLGYIRIRRSMIENRNIRFPVLRCLIWLSVLTIIGGMAKETAVMLPLYACLIEWFLFAFQNASSGKPDRRIIALFILILIFPLIIGLIWLAPQVANPGAWLTRDFTLRTRLLTEPRVVVDYLLWTLVPQPHSLSFYHDDYTVSTDAISPWTTLPSLCAIIALFAIAASFRKRHTLAGLGIGFFLSCHLLTATILPLELVYEHRNYFASYGLILAIISLLFPAVEGYPSDSAGAAISSGARAGTFAKYSKIILLLALTAWWTTLTATTAYAWGDPLRLARELASRAPRSPRAEYELGRTYIIYSHYDPMSPYTQLAYEPLEKASTLPESSILPEQALIFFNSRMDQPLRKKWWNTMDAKLKDHPPGVQDESSLMALTQCAKDRACKLPESEMTRAFQAALSHPNPSARLLATYGDYAWNVQNDKSLGLRLYSRAVKAAPREPAYRITLIRMLVAQQQELRATQQLADLRLLNVGGYLNATIHELQSTISHAQ